MINFYPQFPNRKVINLDGLWDFSLTNGCSDPATPDLNAVCYNDQQAVPGVFDALPDYAGQRGTAFYRTRVSTTPNARLLLKSGGLGMWGAIFWDGKRIAIIDLPYSGMEFEFEAGDGAAHELVVVIDNRFDYQRQPLLSQFYDYYCHGGIFRSIEIHELPSWSLDRAQVTTLDLDGHVKVKVQLTGNSPENAELSYRFDSEPAKSLTLPVQGGTVEFEAQLANPALWSVSSTNLHTLELTLPNGDRIVERFGLRIVEAKAGKILLNGEPLKLHGYCRHESHPEFGPALPLQIVIEDLQLLKKTGCNFVRGSHYPQDQRFLDLCDEHGILVWEESIGWGDRENHLTDPNFCSAQLRQLPWMVKNSFNHPSVIMWGYLNESDSSLPAARPLYEKMTQTLRQLDSTRPITYASMFYEKDINFDLVDIISLNAYPGWYANNPEVMRPLGEIRRRLDVFLAFLHESGFDDKPFILSEIGAGAIYGWRDRFHAHWSEEYQADYLDEVCSYVNENDRISGVALWQFLDCRTYSTSYALGRPRAFNNKGLFDEYRRPKLAFDAVRKHFVKDIGK